MLDTVSAISESLIECYNWMSFLMYSSFILKLLIFFGFFIFVLVVYNWCLYAPSVCKFCHIQKRGTWFLVMLSEEIQHFFTYLILREKYPSKKGLFNQKDFQYCQVSLDCICTVCICQHSIDVTLLVRTSKSFVNSITRFLNIFICSRLILNGSNFHTCTWNVAKNADILSVL